VRVLVTGGAGFIGSRVVAALVADGHEVVVLDSLRPDVHGRAPSLPAPLAHARVVRGDLRDEGALAGVLSGVDAVAHLAGKVGLGVGIADMTDYVTSNDLGTAVLLTAVAGAGIGRLAYASSMVVYGEGAYDCAEHGRVAPGPRRREDLDAGRFEPPCPVCGRPLAPAPVTEDAAPDPRNTYAATKLHGEHLAASWARETGGRAAALRFHNVYGPGMPRDTPYAGVAALFRSALEAGRAPRVFEDGGQRRDFVHVDDVAAAVVAALTSPAVPEGASRPYNVGSGTVTTVGQMAAVLARAVGGLEPVITGEYRLGDVRHVTASSTRLVQELGWAPRTAVAEGFAALATAPLRPAAPG
jgi:dTDP-L-rhamnose 4-epimerase